MRRLKKLREMKGEVGVKLEEGKIKRWPVGPWAGFGPFSARVRSGRFVRFEFGLGIRKNIKYKNVYNENVKIIIGSISIKIIIP